MEKGDKKIIRGWVFYDWANSVYNLVISSAIFPIVYDNLTTKNYMLRKYGDASLPLPKGDNPTVLFFGSEISNSVVISFVLSASFLLVSILSPLLSGVADYSGSKKGFLQFFCYLGALSCIGLSFFNVNHLELSLLALFFANVGFWNSLVFYNAYLPEIADPIDHDKISARGFSMGYIGSMTLLIICLVLIQKFKVNPMWCFTLVGIWWIGFSQFTYRVLPKNVYGKKPEKRILLKGFQELRKVFKTFRKTKRLKRYLYSFFFFNTGVQTVMLMATIFAKKEVTWPIDAVTGKTDDSGLIIAILLIQILGAIGAFLMSRLSAKIGNIKTLGTSIVIWIGVCFAAFFIVNTPTDFYILACVVGLVMGGVQAIARSTYSKYLPETTDHASYFSFYDVTEKIGIVLGTLFFGLMELYFDSIRYSVISIAFFFVIGLLLLFFIPKDEKALDLSETVD